MFHVENTLAVKGLTFTREETDKNIDGVMYTSYEVTRDSRLDIDPRIASVTLYSDGYVLATTAPYEYTAANCKAVDKLRDALQASDLVLSRVSSPRFLF